MRKIFDMISLDRIKIIDASDKNSALLEIVDLLAKADSVKDGAEVKKAIFDREKILSTSIGLGIAIPHVRLESVTEMTIAIGVSKKGVDYDAFDDQLVHIIIMIASPLGTHREYLSVLAKIALLLKNSALRESLLKAETPEDIHMALKGH
ncbi:PTS sugar transporter subunit IIA [bacterium]|nr:PTS sugar transporter subunit IIA [bacterium]